MPFAHLASATFCGIEASKVDIEVDLVPSDKLTFIIVGLPDTAVKESKDRVLTALKNSGYSLNYLHCVINLAPGDLKKEGSLYDLPIALGLLFANKNFKTKYLEDYLVIGELALSGELRHVNGVLLSASLAKSLGKRGIIVPFSNAREASLVNGIEVVAVKHLQEAIHFLEKGVIKYPIDFENSSDDFKCVKVDFSDIKGHSLAKRALEIAAAGGHNILLSGPPGSGKTLLAKALNGIMPDLSVEEALEVTKIHSIAGLIPEGKNFIKHRPFRSPHHTISYAGLIGGGSNPRPGEVSLAHRGVLFLDELPEFSRHTLEVLRQPLEDKSVTISRANGTTVYPTDFIFVAAMNPCPCGFLGHPEKICRDSERQVHQYRSKISGPLLDRIDLQIEVPQIKHQEMFNGQPSESSEIIRNRVIRARKLQENRFNKVKTNSQMNIQDMKQFITLSEGSQKIIEQAFTNLGISNRALDRLQKVALTISDLEEASLNENHILEALQYRCFQ